MLVRRSCNERRRRIVVVVAAIEHSAFLACDLGVEKVHEVEANGLRRSTAVAVAAARCTRQPPHDALDEVDGGGVVVVVVVVVVGVSEIRHDALVVLDKRGVEIVGPQHGAQLTR